MDETSFIRKAADDIVLPTTLECVGDFLDQNEPTILALTAIALSLFGFAVWSAGRRLHKAALALRAAADDSSRLRLRAQVGIAGMEPDWTEMMDDHRKRENSVSVSVKNFGMTAAEQVRIAVQLAPEPPDGRALSNVAETSASFTLFSGQTVTIALAPPNAAHPALYVVGHIRYADVYGQNWRTNFCWVSQESPASVARFVPYGPYNQGLSET